MIWPTILVVAAMGGASDQAETEDSSARRATVAITVVNLEHDRGTVRCAIYWGKKGFPTDPKRAYRGVTAKPKNGKAQCRFEGLKPDEFYAVAIFHDENDNKDLDTNFIGIPKEGIAASNDAPMTFGPPSWDDAKFRVPAKGFTQTVKMDY